MIVTGKQPVPEDILQYGDMIEDFIGKPVEFEKLVACLTPTLEKIRDLHRMTAQKRESGTDTALIEEYTRLLRLVRITQNMSRRYRNIPWAERIALKEQEERLASLHTLLGFTDTPGDRGDRR
jgi:DNA-binding NtrC family response regulator